MINTFSRIHQGFASTFATIQSHAKLLSVNAKTALPAYTGTGQIEGVMGLSSKFLLLTFGKLLLSGHYNTLYYKEQTKHCRNSDSCPPCLIESCGRYNILNGA